MDGKSLERRVMKGRSKKEEGRSEEAKGSYEYRLKLERDRERSHRKSEQGAFDFASSSLDDMTCLFEDPSKIALFSDHGKAARQIHGDSKKDILAEAMKLLIKRDDQIAKAAKESPATRKKNEPKRARQRAKDLAFVKAVLEHKNHADLGITQRGFNWKLKEIGKKFLSISLPPSPKNPRLKGEGVSGLGRSGQPSPTPTPAKQPRKK